MGKPKVYLLLPGLCAGRRLDSTISAVFQWRDLSHNWCIRRCLWTAIGLRCDLAKQPADPDIPTGANQGKVVRIDLWWGRIDFWCYRSDATSGPLCTPGRLIFWCRIIVALGLETRHDLELKTLICLVLETDTE